MGAGTTYSHLAGRTTPNDPPSDGTRFRNTYLAGRTTQWDHLGPNGFLCRTSDGPLGPPGTRTSAQVSGLALVALTSGQWFICAVLALTFTVAFVVWPVVRPKHYTQRELDGQLTHSRLMHEIAQHDD